MPWCYVPIWASLLYGLPMRVAIIVKSLPASRDTTSEPVIDRDVLETDAAGVVVFDRLRDRV